MTSKLGGKIVLAVWQSEYETGHSQIDAQHQEIFQLINNLSSAVSKNADCTELNELLARLKEHTASHFDFEDNLVRNMPYRRLNTHRSGHENILYSLSKVSKKFAKDSSYLTLETLQSLTEAILQHIVEEDLPMVQSLLGSQLAVEAI